MEDNAVSIYWVWTAGVVLAYLMIGMARKRKATGSLEEFCYGDIYADDFLPCVGIDISFGYFIPLVLVCIFEISAVGFYPHETCLVLDKATPSYSTNNWIWTSIAAFLSPLPVGTQIVAMISLFNKSYPESDIIKYILIALNVIGIVCVTSTFADVYSIWYIWIPIISGIMYSTLLWPLTPKEKKAYNDKTERDKLVYTSPSSTPSSPLAALPHLQEDQTAQAADLHIHHPHHRMTTALCSARRCIAGRPRSISTRPDSMRMRPAGSKVKRTHISALPKTMNTGHVNPMIHSNFLRPEVTGRVPLLCAIRPIRRGLKPQGIIPFMKMPYIRADNHRHTAHSRGGYVR